MFTRFRVLRDSGDAGSGGSSGGNAGGNAGGAGPAAQSGGGSAGKEAGASAGPRVAPQEAQDAFARAQARKAATGQTRTPAEKKATATKVVSQAVDNPNAGSREERDARKAAKPPQGKSMLEQLKERSRKHNPAAKTVNREIRADDTAMPGKGPSEVESIDEPEVEPLNPNLVANQDSNEASTTNNRSRDDAEAASVDVTEAVGDDAAEQVEEGELGEEVVQDDGVFTPSLKFKAFGKDHDIPEMFHSLIKDPESQRQVHELFEKAQGMETYRTRLAAFNQEFETKALPEIQFHRQTREMFNGLIQKGDIFGILGKMNIPEERVLQAVAQHVRIKQLPPEQRAQYEARAQAEKTAEQAESQAQQLAQRLAHVETQMISASIESTFARGDVQSVAQDFDGRVGKAGAFEAMVREYGGMQYAQGKNISPEQAVKAIMDRFGLSFSDAAQAGAPGARPAARQGTSAVTRPVGGQAQKSATKIIPNIAARATANARSKPQVNNLEDLRKLRTQMRGR